MSGVVGGVVSVLVLAMVLVLAVAGGVVVVVLVYPLFLFFLLFGKPNGWTFKRIGHPINHMSLEPTNTSAKRRQLSDSEKKDIVQEVQKNALTPNWQALADQYQLPVAKLRLLYNQLVGPEEHVQATVQQLTELAVTEMLAQEGFDCTLCQDRFYHPIVKYWQQLPYCDECHLTEFQSVVSTRWLELNAHLQANHQDCCQLCSKVALFCPRFGYRYHLDHLNMFDKSDSVYSMIWNGTDLNTIKAELTRCQVLCSSCHGIVTKIEQRCGFTRWKQVHTRNSQTGDLDSMGKLYSQWMNPVYDHIRQALNKKRKLK